jgi:hypothetical protein
MPLNENEKVQLPNEFVEQLVDRGQFRYKVNEHINDYCDSVEFMKKVREYAGMEIDSRIFTSFKFWATTILSALLTSTIGVLIGSIWL